MGLRVIVCHDIFGAASLILAACRESPSMENCYLKEHWWLLSQFNHTKGTNNNVQFHEIYVTFVRLGY